MYDLSLDSLVFCMWISVVPVPFLEKTILLVRLFLIFQIMVYSICVCAKSLQLHLTLCDSMDFRPPGSSVHGILQAKILEWVTMPSSRGIFPTQGSNPHLLRVLNRQAGSLPLVPARKPKTLFTALSCLKQTVKTNREQEMRIRFCSAA